MLESSDAAISARRRVPEAPKLSIAERALVQPVQPVLPREADAAERLDRRLADPDRALAGVRLRRRGGDRRLRVSGRHAPGGPQRERARELDARVRVRERVRDGLVDADLLPELLARRRVLDRVLEREPRDAARLERERGLRAGLDLGEDAGVGEPPSRLAAADDAERARLVRRREHLALGALELVDAVAADDRDAVGSVEVGDERPERERPARLAGRDLRAQVRRAAPAASARSSRSTARGRARGRAPRRGRPPRRTRAPRRRPPRRSRRRSSRARRAAPRSAPESPRGTRAPAREAPPARV